MRKFFARRIIIASIVFVIFGVGFFVFRTIQDNKAPLETPLTANKSENPGPIHTIIGRSVEGRNIDAYTYPPRRQASGKKENHLVFVGGIHGGYEWNSVILAYKFIDYLEAIPEAFPANVKVTVIPSANPDGVYKVVGKDGRFASTDVSIDKQILASGRFNARGVDINRNFDCKWKPKSIWQTKIVSAGESPFSEPEAATIRNFVLENNPTAVIFWHSQSGSVYASKCEAGILPETLNIMEAYARASGYSAVETFDAYKITGDSEGWLASIGIPAITVELKTHETIEWEQNLAGIKALFKYYLEKIN